MKKVGPLPSGFELTRNVALHAPDMCSGILSTCHHAVNCTAAGGASNTSCHCLPRTQASHSWSARSQSCSFSTCCRASVPDSCREPCQGTSPTFRTGMPAHIISFPSIHQARDLSTSQACQTSQAAEAAASRQEPESGPARIYWDKRHAGVYRADPRQELTINMLQVRWAIGSPVSPQGCIKKGAFTEGFSQNY